MTNTMRPVSETTSVPRPDAAVTARPVSITPPRLRKTHKLEHRPPFDSIALLLQGGGALGAYQAGVYEALAEANLHPDWVVGISIGAINASIIAGNPPNLRVEKLRAFWESVTYAWLDVDAGALSSRLARGDAARGSMNQMSAAVALM